jgi:hypothetical protein
MGIFHWKASSFYALEGVCFVIEFDQVWGMCLIGVFPGIVTFRVSFPFDEILEFSCHQPWGSI